MDAVCVHRGILKVNRPVEIYKNRLEDIFPPTIVALDVLLIPIILVGIKHVGSESATLGTVICEN